MEKRKIELLAPAGDMERLKMAVAYGADAVYLAGTTFGMRAFAGNFDQDELYQAVRYCKAHGVDAHVTINTMPRCSEVKELPAWLEVLEDVHQPYQLLDTSKNAMNMAEEPVFCGICRF